MINNSRNRVHDYHNMNIKYHPEKWRTEVPQEIKDLVNKWMREDGTLWIGWIDNKYHRLTCKDLQIKLWTKAEDYVTWIETKATKEILTEIRKDIENYELHF